MNTDLDSTFDLLRDLPAEITLEQVGTMVTAFPLASASSSWYDHFDLNSILMSTAGSLLVASSMYVLTATGPTAATPLPTAPLEIAAPEEAVVWAPPREEPVVRMRPIAPKPVASIPAAREPLVAEIKEPGATILPEPTPEPVKAVVWVRDEVLVFDVTGFTGVKLLGAMDVVIQQGAFHVEAEGNPDLAALFDLEVIGGTLHISDRAPKGDERQRSCKNGAVITIRMPTLERIELLGSGTVHASEFDQADRFFAELNGSGAILMEGLASIKEFKAILKGSGDILSENMNVEGRTEVELSGSGDIRLLGRTAQLDVDLIGSGDVDASGLRSKDCRVHVRGSGDVVVDCSSRIEQSTTGSGEIHDTGNAGRVRGEGTRTY